MRTLAGAAMLLALLPVTAAAPGRAGATEAATRAAAAAEPPSVLADGSPPRWLPAAVRRFNGRPVIGARRIRASAPASPCTRERGARFVTAWLSPDGLSIISARPRSRTPHACDAIRLRNAWRRCAVGVARSSDPARIARAGGALGVCKRGGAWRAFMWIASSERADWALVQRRGFWVAYPTAGVRTIRISGTERILGNRFRTTVVFLDSRGRLVERRRVVGVVAG